MRKVAKEFATIQHPSKSPGRRYKTQQAEALPEGMFGMDGNCMPRSWDAPKPQAAVTEAMLPEARKDTEA